MVLICVGVGRGRRLFPLAGYCFGCAWECYWVAGVLRYACNLHATWMVNSVAHLWGYRPYLPGIMVRLGRRLVASLSSRLGTDGWIRAPISLSTRFDSFEAAPTDLSMAAVGGKHTHTAGGELDGVSVCRG